MNHATGPHNNQPLGGSWERWIFSSVTEEEGDDDNNEEDYADKEEEGNEDNEESDNDGEGCNNADE